MDPIEEKLEKRAELLKALANPVRLRILRELCVNKTNVTALCTKLQIPQPTISHHLLILKNAGIVNGERCGAQITYHVDCEKLKPFIKQLIED
ncbi:MULTISPECIES: ArsR/SmtB family transcription factor [Caproicibacterium]|uniref:Metalloregulator ArsR/SmtB family transcription factor n=1 Tax=Caproicibacterium argilliputei TaxID=3030016 RepID=A0AA97H240_9FIRM|nr:metalloregulator ArsR/SmtB family transcription factor [Caproicibacterium argilliputei]WOC33196.1 metalloregulator ArsR/SmtB family transcription factor [Caproicibacterium argilliputei]